MFFERRYAKTPIAAAFLPCHAAMLLPLLRCRHTPCRYASAMMLWRHAAV